MFLKSVKDIINPMQGVYIIKDDYPKELLELINECLKPKAVEKKTFGEVFTPMDFINDKHGAW